MMLCDKHGSETLQIVNKIAEVCAGHDSACVYLALSMMIGGAAARAPKPNLPEVLRLVSAAATAEFENSRALIAQPEGRA